MEDARTALWSLRISDAEFSKVKAGFESEYIERKWEIRNMTGANAICPQTRVDLMCKNHIMTMDEEIFGMQTEIGSQPPHLNRSSGVRKSTCSLANPAGGLWKENMIVCDIHPVLLCPNRPNLCVHVFFVTSISFPINHFLTPTQHKIQNFHQRHRILPSLPSDTETSEPGLEHKIVGA